MTAPEHDRRRAPHARRALARLRGRNRPAADPASTGADARTIWPAHAEPRTRASKHDGAVEVGVRFRTDVDGLVTGIRFYKGPGNTGRHLGTLWTASGEVLATATFHEETARGWQHAALVPPVPVRAGTTYVASYHAPRGRFAKDAYYFGEGSVTNPPLRALGDGEDGPNGVRLLGRRGFPDEGHRATNYWVDVTFLPTGPDAEAGDVTVLERHPVRGETLVPTATAVTVRFSTPVDPASVALELSDRQGVPLRARLEHDVAAGTVRLRPHRPLQPHAPYTVHLLGVQGRRGEPLREPESWTFVTAPLRHDPRWLAAGPGGPVLVAGTTGFARYVPEILRAEGFASFSVVDVARLTGERLDEAAVLVLGETTLEPEQAAMLDAWVARGGRLVALRPDPLLAGLLGLRGPLASQEGGTLLVDTSAPPGRGIHAGPLRVHGPVDRYLVDDATVVAELAGDEPAAAVTWRRVGSGGIAAAFAFDLARSVVLTRQGNPDWVDQHRLGTTPCRASDLFFGGAADDPQPDWVDVDHLHVPHADEQQRLLVNVLLALTADRLPVPRFAYFPHAAPALVVMTGDSHARGNGTPAHFEEFARHDPPVRATSYVYAREPMTREEASAFDAAGFEIALHVSPNRGRDFDADQLRAALATQLGELASAYPALPAPVTNRNHAVAWSGWTTVPEVLRTFGIRLDTSYYHYPGPWIGAHPGFLTGSGLPMRFARLDGSVVDTYQAATQLTDESGSPYPETIDRLLDGAIGPSQFAGAFVVNMHTDFFPNGNGCEACPAMILASATLRGVRVISARALLEWLDHRGACTVTELDYAHGELRFALATPEGPDGLTVCIPAEGPDGRATAVHVDQRPVPFRVATLKGVAHVLADGVAGSYTVTYGRAATR